MGIEITAGIELALGDVAQSVSAVGDSVRSVGTRFIPKRESHTTQTPAAGIPSGTFLWVIAPQTPKSGKIWNIRAAQLYSLDTGGNSSWDPGSKFGTAIATGIPDMGDGTTTLNMTAHPSFIHNIIGGTWSTGAIPVANTGGPETYSRYCFWLRPNEQIYGVIQPNAGASFQGNVDMVLTFQYDEYNTDAIVPDRIGGHGGTRKWSPHNALPEA